MHALSIKQPYAEAIARGTKRREYRTWRAPVLLGKDLLIVASRTLGEGYAGEPVGVAICVVRIVKMTGDENDYTWHLADPRRVVPIAVRGFAALYTVPTSDITYVAGVGAGVAVGPGRPKRTRG